MAAFDAALRHGADMIELDLQCAADGTIVVLHDETLRRLWGIDRPVSAIGWGELAVIEHDGACIPSFSMVLEHIAIPLMVDFTGADVVAGALDAVREAGALDRCLFVTGNVPALLSLRDLEAEARIGLTWIEREPPDPAVLLRLRAEFWNPMFTLVDAAVVEAMHGRGLSVSTWTVDEPDVMERMAENRVDAIVSNRIGTLRRLLDAR
jgi:glycerophosphoryl diester phosphodiesterase